MRALLIQALAFLLCVALLALQRQIFHRYVPLYVPIALQALLAASFAYWRGMEWWWWLIHLCFFPAVVALLALGFAPQYFLIGFVVCVLLFWSVFRTRVPYYPSRASLLPIMLDLLPLDRPWRFVDLGSGLGGLAIKLAAARPEGECHGVELAPLPWLLSRLRARMAKSRARFWLLDYQRLELSDYDFVFAYLSPAAMPALWDKARREMRPGSMLLSYEFVIPNTNPDLCINTGGNAPILYAWRI